MYRRDFLNFAAVGPAAPWILQSRLSKKPMYRACVIGDTGHGNYGHSQHLLWSLHPAVKVVGLADPDPKGRREHAAESGSDNTYADFREMLAREKPDLVAVGPRWTVNHRDYVIACAEVGAHGIIEKPLAVDMAEADQMLDATSSQNLKWAISFNQAASPIIQHARKVVIEDGLIGEVLEIRARGKEDRRAGAEDMIVLGCHIFDIMISFLGPPLWCTSSISEGERPASVEDVREATESLGPIVGNRIQATFGFEGAINGYFSSQKNSHGNQGRWGLDIYGTQGMVTIRTNHIARAAWLPDPSWATGKDRPAWRPLPGAPIVEPGPSEVWYYAPIVTDLIEAIEMDREPRTSLADGRAALEMTQAVFESHIQGGQPVRFPLSQRDHPLKRWGAS